MNFSTQNAKNLLSKDLKTAKTAARAIIEGRDTEAFQEICEKSEFIFDFIKERVTDNLLEAVTKTNCANLLLFTPYYCADFEDFVVGGLVKFAREELTDALLEIFEEGTEDQKTYCAAYFVHILDPLALELLKMGSASESLALKTNCAKALKAFGDRELYDAAIEKLKDNDELGALKAVEFLVAYGDAAAFEPIYKFMKETPYAPYVALDLLGFRNFEELLADDKRNFALNIFDAILNGYPEILPLHSILYADIKGLLGALTERTPSPREAKLILKAKVKFDLISSSENYTFDLDKPTKSEIKEITLFLDTLPVNLYAQALETEFERNDEDVIDLFEIVAELHFEQYADKIAQKIGASNHPPLICEGVKALKELGRLDLANEETLAAKMGDDPNLVALLRSYFSST